MKTYKQFLTEASTKNLHLEHLEDEVLNGGVNGTRGAINFLRSLRDMLAGSSKSSTTVTVKWDGAPAVAAGIDPQSGQFFVAYKSMKKLCFTQEDVRQNFDGPLQKIYSALMEHLPKLNIKSNVYQGDVLWYDESQKKKQTIDGQKWLTFTPNTITYAVPVNSDIATTIDMAAVGIVFHTTYSTGGAETVDDLKASFGADTSSFTKHRDVWSINADFTDLSGHATFTERETTTITSMLSEAGKTFNQINGRFLDAIAQDDKIKVLIKTYLNSKIRDGEFIRNINKTAKEVVQFIKDRLEADVAKLKTPKGRQKKQAVADGYLKLLGGNDAQLQNIFKIMGIINNAKLYIVNKLENVQGMTSTFVRTDNGYRITKPEGFVAIDRFNNEKGLKLVNRLEFSRANFNVDKNWDQ
tara:strand:- start:4018 stop:5250 length:1233 start_codon:yes stop_codon:yes gene_type:complete